MHASITCTGIALWRERGLMFSITGSISDRAKLKGVGTVQDTSCKRHPPFLERGWKRGYKDLHAEAAHGRIQSSERDSTSLAKWSSQVHFKPCQLKYCRVRPWRATTSQTRHYWPRCTHGSEWMYQADSGPGVDLPCYQWQGCKLWIPHSATRQIQLPWQQGWWWSQGLGRQKEGFRFSLLFGS